MKALNNYINEVLVKHNLQNATSQISEEECYKLLQKIFKDMTDFKDDFKIKTQKTNRFLKYIESIKNFPINKIHKYKKEIPTLAENICHSMRAGATCNLCLTKEQYNTGFDTIEKLYDK